MGMGIWVEPVWLGVGTGMSWLLEGCAPDSPGFPWPSEGPLWYLLGLSLLILQACKDICISNLWCSYHFQFFVPLLVGPSKTFSLPLIFNFVTNTYFVLLHFNLIRHQGVS